MDPRDEEYRLAQKAIRDEAVIAAANRDGEAWTASYNKLRELEHKMNLLEFMEEFNGS